MAKVPAEGKKVVVRRLPPGMTADEFWTIIGHDWKVGNGKVDWVRYDDGELAEDASDYSQPAACYLHVLKLEHIVSLADAVQQAKWEDAKQTTNDPALIGPPCLDIAPNQKLPTGKKRSDPRQGTIDSDPEFMKFLENLTAPVQTKESTADQTIDDGGKADAKVTTTPLVEYIKEKKASKAKEAALAKSAKHARHESQTKGKEDTKKKGKEAKGDKADKSSEKEKEKPKEPVKLLTKKAVAQEAADAIKNAAGQNTSASTSSKAVEEPTPKSRRANIAAAAKILQRDLGLSPGSAHRKARQDAAKAGVAPKADIPKDTKETEAKGGSASTPAATNPPATATSPSPPTAPKAQLAEGSKRNRGGKGAKQSTSGTGKGKENESSTTGKAPPMATPVILKRKEETTPAAETSTPAPAATTSAPVATPPTGPKAITGKATAKQAQTNQKKGATAPLITAGATSGFVKHANPSQGVTEPLLKQAMEVFGNVTFVEIDKRKGFAYVDFREHDGLVKAITASPITVAQGTVQVLERKETKKAVQTPTATTPAASTATPPVSENKTTETAPERSKRGSRGRGRRGGGNTNNASGKAEANTSTATSREARATASASAG
ncbi:hypothetical protein F5Y16DRAFT_403409 [Xylariaceae sp. FL0255]|nr:hypothetical protein F5Y16DRAFT_403409 [Xylariaceae sp. FL0255]